MFSTKPASAIYLHEPSITPSKTPRKIYLIYFITGNPGLIEYYRTFLVRLYGVLRSADSSVNYHVYGRSLSGFELDSSVPANNHGPRPPYLVQEQIEHSERTLSDLVKKLRTETGTDVRVILVGHSLGTYMCMEILRRLRERAAKDPLNGIRIVGSICLFSTVMDLAKSANGRKFARLLALPHFALLISLLAKALTILIPTTVVALLIRLFMGFPTDAASVTAAFGKSRRGIRQALYMAHDEMRAITIDKWDDDLWGAARPTDHPHPRPTLRFLFAKSDHWVADETRDTLIKIHGANGDDGEKWKPRMEVDEEEGWPHGFCIRHSIPVADRVKTYVEDIVSTDTDLKQ